MHRKQVGAEIIYAYTYFQESVQVNVNGLDGDPLQNVINGRPEREKLRKVSIRWLHRAIIGYKTFFCSGNSRLEEHNGRD
ncbi:hypothetical protein TWF694_003412 [Orbilia ellipsospora]|uniref:Uncharacterized protein n=1 Tax=Orbilia ellipsospora TaxID=2528407 RepID=A0AAV9WZ54_9PEZI